MLLSMHNEKANGIQLEEINSKISDLIEANASNTKLQAENENNISNQIGKLSERLTKISKAGDDLSTGLTFINGKTAELSDALKVTCNTMSDNISVPDYHVRNSCFYGCFSYGSCP
jgi:predicted transcriptional regulator